MKPIKEQARESLAHVLKTIPAASEASQEVGMNDVVVETPPRPELGDVAAPMFPFSRMFRMAPQAIAEQVCAAYQKMEHGIVVRAEAAGPYVNLHLDRAAITREIIKTVESENVGYGSGSGLSGERVMIEFSCPNTNKPLHVGHLRNDILGTSVANILRAAGATVLKVNLINDRGIHICQSMAGYLKYGDGATPESEGVKSDHFVGEYYVKFHQWKNEEREAAESAARDLLVKWEQGDSETTELWERMNSWAIGGIESTYERTGISFDRVYRESTTYKLGRDQIREGLARGVFFEKEDGSVWIDLEEIGLDQKVLLRSDGTSVYMTQDVGTAIQRHEDWPFDRMIYVVASEQEYHFTVLFETLRRLGYQWASDLFHLSYGLVNLRDGRMKSREGTVVDADDLIDRLEELAKQEIRDKGRDEMVGDLDATATAIALGAIHYYLLQVTPRKDIVFDPAESIAFNGNTGPYLQYTGARISSMLRKYAEGSGDTGTLDCSLIVGDAEWEITKSIAEFPETIEQAAKEYNPAIVGSYCFSLAKLYSRYYHDHPVLHNDDPNLVASRVVLSESVRNVLRNGLALLGIDFLESM